MGNSPQPADNRVSFTVQGIWQPENPDGVRRERRAFSACVRWAVKDSRHNN